MYIILSSFFAYFFLCFSFVFSFVWLLCCCSVLFVFRLNRSYVQRADILSSRGRRKTPHRIEKGKKRRKGNTRRKERTYDQRTNTHSLPNPCVPLLRSLCVGGPIGFPTNIESTPHEDRRNTAQTQTHATTIGRVDGARNIHACFGLSPISSLMVGWCILSLFPMPPAISLLLRPHAAATRTYTYTHTHRHVVSHHTESDTKKQGGRKRERRRRSKTRDGWSGG